MYQKRELATSRDLVKEFLKEFPTSPLWPEASLLAGYVELADCKFDDSQKWYDTLVARLQPIVDEIDKVRKDPELRKQLFANAITRFREVKQTGELAGKKPGTEKRRRRRARSDVLALLRLDPKFIRLNDARHRRCTSSPTARPARCVRQWQNLGAAGQRDEGRARSRPTRRSSRSSSPTPTRSSRTSAGSASRSTSPDGRARARAGAKARCPPTSPTRSSSGSTPLLEKVDVALSNAPSPPPTRPPSAIAERGRARHPADDPGRPRRARAGSTRPSHALARQARREAGDKLAQAAIDKLYNDTRRVLDKAKLGKIDAVIGQKRKLDIEVQDLAAGRFPEELIGRMWNASMIGDDEEYWPCAGRVLGRRVRGVAMKTLAWPRASLLASRRARAQPRPAASEIDVPARPGRRALHPQAAARARGAGAVRRSSRTCSTTTEKRRDDKRLEAIGLLRGFLDVEARRARPAPRACSSSPSCCGKKLAARYLIKMDDFSRALEKCTPEQGRVRAAEGAAHRAQGGRGPLPRAAR